MLRITLTLLLPGEAEYVALFYEMYYTNQYLMSAFDMSQKRVYANV